MLLGSPTPTNVTVVEPAPDLVAATKAFVEADLALIARLNEEQYGVADAAAKVARFRDLVARWNGLVDGIDSGDADAVAALYKREIFDRLDPARYGRL